MQPDLIPLTPAEAQAARMEILDTYDAIDMEREARRAATKVSRDTEAQLKGRILELKRALRERAPVQR